MRKRTANTNKSERVRRERDPIPWRYCLLTLLCGLILVAGFFWAARLHFSAMDFGIKNAKLRQLKENLESEQRRLYLTKEISLSPAEIKKAAKKFGLQDLTVQNIEVFSPKAASAENSPKDTIAKQAVQIEKIKDEKSKDKPADAGKIVKSADAKKDKDSKPQTAATGDIRSRIAKK